MAHLCIEYWLRSYRKGTTEVHAVVLATDKSTNYWACWIILRWRCRLTWGGQ